MKIVLDTNILVAILSRNSKVHWIWQAMKSGKFEVCFSTDMLFEYEEILAEKYGRAITKMVLDILKDQPNSCQVNTFYNWNFMHNDPDDNKFVDCAIAAGAKFLVSEDRHFRILAEIDFPKVEVITLPEFADLLLKNQPTS